MQSVSKANFALISVKALKGIKDESADMKIKGWKGLSETTKRNLCMLPGVLMLGAIWLSETLNPGKPQPVGQFSIDVSDTTNFVAVPR